MVCRFGLVFFLSLKKYLFEERWYDYQLICEWHQNKPQVTQTDMIVVNDWRVAKDKRKKKSLKSCDIMMLKGRWWIISC